MRNRTAGAIGVIAFFFSTALLAQAQPSRPGFAPQSPAVDEAGHREWVWQGGDSLSYAGSGHVRYQPGGTPRIIVTGDPAEVENVEVVGGLIRRNDSHGFNFNFNFGRRVQGLDILVRGVTLDRFSVAGSAMLDLGQLNRDTLDLRVFGSGTINAQGGEVKNLRLEVDGSGGAGLDHLNIETADVKATGSGKISLGDVAGAASLHVTGSGSVSLGRVQTVNATLTGSGVVRLTSAPSQANYKIMGSGQVLLVEPDGKVSILGRMDRLRGRDRDHGNRN